MVEVNQSSKRSQQITLQKREEDTSESASHLEVKKRVDGHHGQLPQCQLAQRIFAFMQDNFYLFLNQFKNSSTLLTMLLQQLTIAVLLISKTGRTHGHLTLSSVYFPIFKGTLKTDGLLKIGDLASTLHMSNKEDLLTMPLRYHTPP